MFLDPKTSPPSFKRESSRKACGFCSLKSLWVAFCFHFWCFYSLQQVSIQSLSFLLPIGVFSSSFSALNCENVLIFVGQFWFVFMFDFLSWGFEWEGLRPMLYSEAMGHATLPSFSCNLCPSVRPPSARWNAPMIYEYGFAKLGWWDCFMYLETA